MSEPRAEQKKTPLWVYVLIVGGGFLALGLVSGSDGDGATAIGLILLVVALVGAVIGNAVKR